MARKILTAKEILLKSNVLERIQSGNKYVSEEFQDFGLRLASRLSDSKHKALYINLAKKLPRGILDHAVQFALDYPKINARAKMFMWKLNELCKAKKIKFPSGSWRRKTKKNKQQIKLI